VVLKDDGRGIAAHALTASISSTRAMNILRLPQPYRLFLGDLGDTFITPCERRVRDE
jgi:hypothetical protein